MTKRKSPFVAFVTQEEKRVKLAKDDAQYTHARASLMGLPVEIRLQIFQYLLPDRSAIPNRGPQYMRPRENAIADLTYEMVFPDDDSNLSGREKLGRIVGAARLDRIQAAHAWRVRDGWFQPDLPCWPLREDCGGTSIAMMRTNSLIYAEMRQLLYDHRSFEFYLRGPIFSFCKEDMWLWNRFDPKGTVDSPDHPFRNMRNIEVIIESEVFNCSCSERYEDEDYDCSGTLCYPSVIDVFTTFAYTLSQWSSLRSVTVDIIDRDVSEEEIKSDDDYGSVNRLIKLTKPLGMVRGLEHVEILFYSKAMDWDPKLEHHISELKDTMTTAGSAASRADRPVEKTRMQNAIDFAVAAGVRDFYEPTYSDLMNRGEIMDEVKQFSRTSWEACNSGDEELIASCYEKIKAACQHQKKIADEALGWIDELLENKAATYMTDSGLYEIPFRLT